MSSRHPARYDEQTRRTGEARESRTTRDPREAREPRDSREPREVREAREIIAPRERADIIPPRDGREIRETRDTRIDPRAEPRMDPSRIDSRIDPRADPRVDPRADPRLLSRGDPRADLRGDPRVDARVDFRPDPREIRDSRDIRDPRGESIIDTRDPRYALSRENRDLRDPRDVYGRDEMDIDPPPSGRLTTYFLPGEGISREVIQADICRYLGADATCLPARNREGASGYMIRAYRMLTTKMIEDLMADSKRWDEELRRSRTRGIKPAYEDTKIHEHRQITGPSQNPPGYPGPQSRVREREDYDMDDYPRPNPSSQRTLYQGTMPQDYPQNYPVTTSGFQSPSMTAASEYMITRGPAEGYNQVPRSEYDYPGATAGRGATLQSTNQVQFASQQGLQGPPAYQDPRTGQMVYPPTPAGRGLDQFARHTGPADNRRR
ncbi:hypothetical protein EPUS_00254 [Endocarpon pusillum Z07020]|uniref:Transcription factor RfeG n=1 Tax=Endocarpon pusillum (strain Z07020 / HMAS-L-300199) TaxID=1263415 RepID=U1FYR8_ENDPU|nr:uncharacterized protein EPUS_00254 [Endocarpon pusillum Z07020]ERF70067.1 hypothetical protein EPUS_00254 [Endocarpon pusillum Z07020]